MKKQIAALILAAIPMFGFAAEGAYPLDKVSIDLTDKAALQDGAQPLQTIAWVAMVLSSNVMSVLRLTWVSVKS